MSCCSHTFLTVIRDASCLQVSDSYWHRTKTKETLLSKNLCREKTNNLELCCWAPASREPLSSSGELSTCTGTSPVFLFFRDSVQQPRTLTMLSKCSLCPPAKWESWRGWARVRDAHLLWGGEEGEPFSSKTSTVYFLSATTYFAWCREGICLDLVSPFSLSSWIM